MLIATFGPSSAFVHWCLNALNTISTVTLGEFDYISVSTIQDFKTALAARASKHVHLYTDCPDQGLIEAFQKSQIPFIALEEDPADVVGFLMRDRGLTWMQATRLISMSFSTTAGLFVSPNALRLARANRLSLGDFIEQVAIHLGLDLDQEQFSEIIQRLLPGGLPTSDVEEAILLQIPNAAPIGQRFDLPDTERPIVEQTLSSMRYDRNGSVPQQFSWPCALMVGPDGADKLLRQPLEMLGPARCVVYGPYLHLPAGVWEVALNLEIYENFSGNQIDVDIFHGKVLHIETFKLPISGRMALIVKFSISESREPIQVRIILREGAIEGKLRIGDLLINNMTDQAVAAS